MNLPSLVYIGSLIITIMCNSSTKIILSFNGMLYNIMIYILLKAIAFIFHIPSCILLYKFVWSLLRKNVSIRLSIAYTYTRDRPVKVLYRNAVFKILTR